MIIMFRVRSTRSIKSEFTTLKFLKFQVVLLDSLWQTWRCNDRSPSEEGLVASYGHRVNSQPPASHPSGPD